jgi:glycosyltransferase involved in cell wall biosynthesis
MSPRTVLYTDYYAFVGGGQQNLLSVFGAIDRRRWRPLLALPKEGPFAEAARALDVPVFVTPMGKARWRRPWQAYPAMLRLRRILAAQGADLVHANDFPSHKLAVVAARGLSIPEVYHQQIAVTQRPASTTGRLMRFHLRGASGILAVSANAKRDLVALGLPSDRVRLLYNNADIAGIKAARRAPDRALAALGLPRGRPLILAAGMRRPHKGFDVLLKAAAEFFRNRKGRGPKPFLAILGDSAHAEAGHEARLRELLGAPELKGNAGLYPAQRPLAPWLKRCAVFVSSSRWEGSPLVVLEAMAAGCAIVATRQGAGEVLENGKSGWLADVEDPASLAEGLEVLLKDPALGGRLGARAKREAAERFSLGNYVRELADYYDGLVGV